jgi:hypothetical protein
LEISQGANQISITHRLEDPKKDRRKEIRLMLDGTETINPTLLGRGEVKSKARFEGEKLVVENTRKVSGREDEVEIVTREEWTISADSHTLTITTKVSNPRGRERTATQVYTRQ